MNLTLGKDWAADELEQATTRVCPACCLGIELGSLVVEPDGGLAMAAFGPSTLSSTDPWQNAFAWASVQGCLLSVVRCARSGVTDHQGDGVV